MRILHIITSLRTGGAERLLIDLLPCLQKRGHQVELLLFDGTHTPFYEQLEREGIIIHTLGKGFRNMYNPLHILRLRKFLKRPFDIVHTHNTPCQLFTALACSDSGPMLITTEHSTFNRRRAWKWYGKIDRWMYGKYSHIICVSNEVKRNLEKALDDECLFKRVYVIPNGIDIQRFLTASFNETLRNRNDEKFVIIMVGSFGKAKDQFTLIRAMKLLSDDYLLWLVGDGECRMNCESLVSKLGLNYRITFWGNRSDVPTLLATADVVALSSHYEGMPLSGIEGMCSGKPFIASDVDGLREIAGNAALLFPHEDARQLAVLIRQLCEDAKLYKQVAERCRERAMRYDIEYTVDGYEKIYREK